MQNDGYLLGYDIGSSSVKAVLLDSATGKQIASATSPDTQELEIIAPSAGWAEQHPDTWWTHIQAATDRLRSVSGVNFHDVKAIGISYQMHGLVVLDKDLEPLMPSIIWCDSRAVDIGRKAYQNLGHELCMKSLLNSPGNFTASKLRWVQENRPDVYKRISYFMLPGDYIACKLTGTPSTTASGLSEGILWDFSKMQRADFLLDHYNIDKSLVPRIVPTFGIQGTVTSAAASILGLKEGTPVSYRAGDQPNNAFSLNVNNPGELAATAGTSGVVYGVTDCTSYDPEGRVNTFLHVNNTPEAARLGILLCVNGTGILNRWLRNLISSTSLFPYASMDAEAAEAPACCDGLRVLPYGNGAERTLGNRTLNASVHGLDLTRHSRSHLLRAAQEGIVFALMQGIDIMNTLGLEKRVVRAGSANMFKSELFCGIFATVTECAVELYNTDGAQGAARGAGVGAGIYSSIKDAFAGLSVIKSVDPIKSEIGRYAEAYGQWKSICERQIEQINNQMR
jgi:xylulokinase